VRLGVEQQERRLDRGLSVHERVVELHDQAAPGVAEA
jgi:hypothetical protein